MAGATRGVLFPLLVLTVLAFCMVGREHVRALDRTPAELGRMRGQRLLPVYRLFDGVGSGGLVSAQQALGEGPLVVAGTLLMSAGFATVLIVYSPPMAFVGGTLIAVGFGLEPVSQRADFKKRTG